MADTTTVPASTVAQDVLYALRMFERAVRDDEMAGAHDPDEAASIRRNYREAKRLMREMICLLGDNTRG